MQSIMQHPILAITLFASNTSKHLVCIQYLQPIFLHPTFPNYLSASILLCTYPCIIFFENATKKQFSMNYGIKLDAEISSGMQSRYDGYEVSATLLPTALDNPGSVLSQ